MTLDSICTSEGIWGFWILRAHQQNTALWQEMWGLLRSFSRNTPSSWNNSPEFQHLTDPNWVQDGYSKSNLPQQRKAAAGVGLLIACAPFSSPFTVASPFFGVFCWETAVVVAPAVAAVAAAAAAALACCWASFSLNACCRVCTTSGITASIRDSDSIGLPSNTVPSCGENEPKSNCRFRIPTTEVGKEAML